MEAASQCQVLRPWLGRPLRAVRGFPSALVTLSGSTLIKELFNRGGKREVTVEQELGAPRASGRGACPAKLASLRWRQP